jgi:8-oxo-dGTP pyrophosphatase MutT (NUDIX family)
VAGRFHDADVTFGGFENRLREALGRTLPGIEAQLQMAPTPRPGFQPGHRPPSARSAAALLLFFPRDDHPHIVLTLRGATLPRHAGQVSLPGGAVDPGETIEETAVREAHEETGVDPALVRVLGLLTPLDIPVSGFMLYPVVAAIDEPPAWKPAPHEVDRILEVRLDELLDAQRVGASRMLRQGIEYDVPHFELAGEQVWGATAMVLSELRWLLS